MSSGGESKRILIVDDDPNIRRFLTESLRLRGFEVHSYDSAEASLEELSDHGFDLALLDILLPGTNGLQLCLKLRSLPQTKSLPIIMMTAFYKQADHIQDAREQYGATDYLLKPFPLKVLHEKIDSLIGTPPTSTAMGRLSVEGELSETCLSRILHNLYSLRTTGLLHLESDDIKKVVYIRNGYPIFVRSNLVREFLGQMLIRSGTLTEEDLEKSLTFSQGKGQRHGMALLEMGLITPHQLNDVLQRQVLEKLLDIFSWETGSYKFVQAREFKEGVTSIDLSPANLILQGLRDYASREQSLRILEPHLDQYPHLAENPLYRFQEIQLSHKEQRIFESCHGDMTLRELLKRHLLSRKEAEPLLATLLCTGILVGRQESATKAGTYGSKGDKEALAKREAFLKEYVRMMELDYFTLLGVKETDTREQVRKAYFKLVKTYHPDRFFEDNSLIDLKDKVNSLFQRITDAHETLSDSKARARYENDRKGKSQQSTGTNLEKLLMAETAFQKGMSLFRSRRYDEAQQLFVQALEGNPDEAEYLLYQAWSAYKSEVRSPERTNQTRTNLLRAAELNPKLSQTHLFLGYICKDEGKETEARRRFERAIQADPNCTEALRELRLMSMRGEKSDKDKKGLLGKMFR